MKTLFILLLSVITIGGASAQNKKQKKDRPPFPEQIIRLMESKQFEVEITRISGLPATISNRETPPMSYIILDGNEIKVELPYYDINNARRQGTYNFSDFGRMLSFKSKVVKITSSALNKKGTMYTMRLDTYGTQVITFPVSITISIYPGGVANVSANWRNQNVQYSGKLNSL